MGYAVFKIALKINKKDKSACFYHFCKGSSASKFKKIKNEGAQYSRSQLFHAFAVVVFVATIRCAFEGVSLAVIDENIGTIM